MKMEMEMEIDNAEVLSATWRAVNDFKLCPNRIWAVTRNLPGGPRNIYSLFPAEQDIRILPQIQNGLMEHDRCTFDLCEHSQSNFTSVEQRHECGSKLYHCEHLKDHFPSQILDEAAENGEVTAWKFGGRSLVRFPCHYMAISHVWSDGTGTGAWPEKGLNRCLWLFFRDIARTFQVQGIWWDTISIPNAKAARIKAINRMHRNYEDARFTLVHDCYLREVYWDDQNPKRAAETASLAIVMSPWFSRGWTALELAKSRKVKILFRSQDNFLIKDLDNDILGVTDSPSNVHYTASQAITKLRRNKITTMDDLLTVLGPRYTSWSRDMAIIAGLLVGIETADQDSQQEIYQKILKKFGSLSHEHLFHTSARMSKGFSWCPANLLNTPRASSQPTLRIEENGNIVGLWKALQLSSISKEAFVWVGIHPMTEVYLRAAVNRPTRHVFLVEPEARDMSRALLVRVDGQISALSRACCELVGFLHFQPPQNPKAEDSIEVQASLGCTAGLEEAHKNAWEVIEAMAWKQKQSKNQQSKVTEPANHSRKKKEAENYGAGIYTAEQNKTTTPADSDDLCLHLAVEDGNESQVKRLIDKGANVNVQDKYEWTALHRAVWNGNQAVVEALMNSNADQNLQDRLGQTSLHLAAERGEVSIFRTLLRPESNLNRKCNYDGQTVLHRGAWSGSREIIYLLGQGLHLDAVDNGGRTAFHIAAELANTEVAELLMSWGADANVRDKRGMSALSYAARNGHAAILRLLMKNHNIKINTTDAFGRTPLLLAARYGHEEVIRLLLQHPNINVELADQFGRTPQFHAVLHGYNNTVIQLLSKRNSDETRHENHWVSVSQKGAKDSFEIAIDLLAEPKELHEENPKSRESLYYLQWAANHGQFELAEFLLEHGMPAQPREIADTDLMPLSLAAANGHGGVFQLLLATDEVSLNHYSPDSTPVLLRVAQGGHDKLVKLLIETGEVDVKLRDDWDMTALLYACENGHEAVVERLLATGKISLNSLENQGEMALYFAAKNGHLSIVKLLCMTGEINVDCKINWATADPGLVAYNSPAARSSRTRPRRPWIQRRFHQSSEIRTPLSYAAEKGHTAVVKYLLGSHDVDVNFRRGGGQTPLSFAAEYGHHSVCKLLIESGQADINARDVIERTALMEAARRGHHPIVKQLLETGKIMDLNEEDSRDRRTALSFAAENGNVAIIRELLMTGQPVDIDKPDKLGRTPLSYAAQNSHEAVIRTLLGTGRSIDLNRPDENGDTPLLFGASTANERIWQLLLTSDKFVDINHQNRLGETLLIGAARFGSEAIMRLLLDMVQDVEINHVNQYNQTALDYAVMQGNVDVTVQLLATGKAKLKTGPTALNTGPMYDAVAEALREAGDLESKSAQSIQDLCDQIRTIMTFWTRRLGPVRLI